MTTIFSQETISEFRRGAAGAVPIIMGYIPIGFAFGVLAAESGIGLAGAVAMSVFVYAGSSQFIALGLIESGAAVSALGLTVFLVNLRHMLMSASLAPYLGRFKGWQQALFSYELTDESFGVHSAALRSRINPSPTRMISLNMCAQLSWVGSSAAGAWVGSRLFFDTAVFGLDYALPAMFIALLVLQVESRRHLCIALLAAALSVTLYLAGAGQWHLILATLVTATVGLLTEKIPGRAAGREQS
ncbi:MAG: AzlC family ABC transporter permease [Bacillota bacterium]